MSEIVGACLSQFHDDADTFEVLLIFADGREIGHSVSRKLGEEIAAVFASEFEAAKDAELSLLAAQREWMKDRLSDLQLPPNSTKNIEEWLVECGMPTALSKQEGADAP